MSRNICKKCSKRIPKNVPILVCSVCNESKHPSCQKLSKNDAQYLITERKSWVCLECTSEKVELPENSVTSSEINANDCKIQCSCCNGWSYKSHLVSSCCWCDQIVHNKCNSILGCLDCRKNIIPFQNYTIAEIYNDHNDRFNNFLHNPYHNDHFTNMIGDKINNDNINDGTWGEISDFLVKCKYKQIRNVPNSCNSNLKILSLNVQGLMSKISVIRDNLENFSKYDVLCFNDVLMMYYVLINQM